MHDSYFCSKKSTQSQCGKEKMLSTHKNILWPDLGYISEFKIMGTIND